MKNLILSLCLTLFAVQVFGQSVVISESEATGDASSILDVQSSTKGFLFPRVELESLESPDPIADPAEGLFVFSKNGSVPNGIYYWEGSRWVSFMKEDANPVPVGTILSFGGDLSNLPEGWLLCDGGSYSQSEFADLFEVIGSSWGATGANFNVPDLRGFFLRGADGGAGNDPESSTRTASNSGGNTGDNVGSVQDDAFQGHWHTIGEDSGEEGFTRGFVAGAGSGSPAGTSPNNGFVNRALSPVSDGVNGDPRTASETRPKNAYVNYIIKY